MALKKNHHAKPCENCGHQEMHGEVSGCIAMTSAPGERATWCDCEKYKAPPTAQVARTIQSRNTDPGTSHAADRTITVKANTQRAHLLRAFGRDAERAEARGVGDVDPGLTDEEAMESAQGVSAVSEYAKRCSELRDAGLIEPTGETREGGAGKPRIVSRITDAGRAVLQSL